MKICTIAACGRPFLARGWCGLHYQRWGRYGNPTATQHRTVCLFKGCGNKHTAKGLCDAHYRQHRSGQALRPIKYVEPGLTCASPVCERSAIARGLCDVHSRKGRDINIPVKVTFGRETGLYMHKGYAIVRVFTGWESRNRVVWVQHNGPIPVGFLVHHRNEIKLDDGIMNLQLVTRGEHKAIHNVVT